MRGDMFAKIKITDINFNNYGYGMMTDRDHEALLNDDKTTALILNPGGSSYILTNYQFQIVETFDSKKQNNIVSLADILGQQVKTIEFK